MNLRVYIATRNIRQYQAAKELDINLKYFNNILNYHISPGRKLARKICQWSNNEIKVWELPGWELWRKNELP